MNLWIFACNHLIRLIGHIFRKDSYLTTKFHRIIGQSVIRDTILTPEASLLSGLHCTCYAELIDSRMPIDFDELLGYTYMILKPTMLFNDQIWA